jgi:hypothetical protein
MKRATPSITVLSLAVLLASRGHSIAGEAVPKKDTAVGASKPAKAAKAELPNVRVTGSGYAQKLRRVAEEEKTFGDLRMKAKVIPDAYRYLMAEGIEKIEETGVEGAKKTAKLKSLCAGLKSNKNKVLILFEMSADDRDAFIILRKPPKDHVKLSQTLALTYSLQVEGGPLVNETWKVFGYPPGTNRWMEPRMKLCVLKDARFRLTVALPKDKKGEEISLSLSEVVVHKRGPDPASSIRSDLRQISLRSWEDITVKGAALNFHPGRWEIPEPPAGFDELLERLEKM